MKPLKAIAKSIDKSKDLKKYKTQVDEAVSKAKKAEADDAAKKIKEAADKKKAAAEKKRIYDEGVKKGQKKMKKKVIAGAAVAGTAAYESKTGNVSKAAKAAKDMYDKRNAKPTNAKGAPLKTKGSQTPSWRSKQGVKGNLKNSKK
jgi:hypothetical protein